MARRNRPRHARSAHRRAYRRAVRQERSAKSADRGIGGGQAASGGRQQGQIGFPRQYEPRAPLNAIIGFSDLMQSEVLGPIGSDTYRGYVSDIHFSGCHLLEIINDILDVVRHESGKMELKEDKVPVEDLIVDALRLIAPP